MSILFIVCVFLKESSSLDVAGAWSCCGELTGWEKKEASDSTLEGSILAPPSKIGSMTTSWLEGIDDADGSLNLSPSPNNNQLTLT